MVIVSEGLEDAKLRLFKWKVEDLFNDSAFGYGIFMFVVDNNIRIVQSSVVEEKTKKITKVRAFKVDSLLSPDNMEPLLTAAIKSTGLFFDSTIQFLAKQLATYVLVNFRFTEDSLLGVDGPRLVFVIDVTVSRNLEYANNGNNNNSLEGGDDCEMDAEEDENVPEEEDLDFSGTYLGEILGDEDEEPEEIVFEGDENLSSEVMEIARTLISSLVETPEVLAQTKPRPSHFRGFEKVTRPVKIKAFDGELELCKCQICGNKILKGAVVAILPCLHLVHRDCIYNKVPDFHKCTKCGLSSVVSI